MSITTALKPSDATLIGSDVLAGGAADYTSLHEPDDTDTSYLWTNGASIHHSYGNLDNLPRYAREVTLVYVRALARLRPASESAARNFGLQIGGSHSYGTLRALGGWTVYSEPHALSPTGVSWTPALVDLSNWLVHCTDGLVSRDSETTSFTVNVTWSPFATSWTSMLLGVLPFALGTNLLFAQMPALIADFNRASQGEHTIHGNAAVQMYEDLKANPHRRYLI